MHYFYKISLRSRSGRPIVILLLFHCLRRNFILLTIISERLLNTLGVCVHHFGNEKVNQFHVMHSSKPEDRSSAEAALWNCLESFLKPKA